jgi:hypothetical protein
LRSEDSEAPPGGGKGGKALGIITMSLGPNIIHILDNFDDLQLLMVELQHQFMPNQKSRLTARMCELTSIQLKTGEELNSYFTHFNAIISKLNSNPHFTTSKGVCKTLLLKGLPSDYKTISTVISMSDKVSSTSVQGLLHQHKSKLCARKQAKKEQAMLFTTMQQSLQSSSPSLNPHTHGSCRGQG